MFFKISILIANLTATKPSEGEGNGGKVKTAKWRIFAVAGLNNKG